MDKIKIKVDSTTSKNKKFKKIFKAFIDWLEADVEKLRYIHNGHSYKKTHIHNNEECIFSKKENKYICVKNLKTGGAKGDSPQITVTTIKSASASPASPDHKLVKDIVSKIFKNVTKQKDLVEKHSTCDLVKLLLPQTLIDQVLFINLFNEILKETEETEYSYYEQEKNIMIAYQFIKHLANISFTKYPCVLKVVDMIKQRLIIAINELISNGKDVIYYKTSDKVYDMGKTITKKEDITELFDKNCSLCHFELRTVTFHNLYNGKYEEKFFAKIFKMTRGEIYTDKGEPLPKTTNLINFINMFNIMQNYKSVYATTIGTYNEVVEKIESITKLSYSDKKQLLQKFKEHNIENILDIEKKLNLYIQNIKMNHEIIANLEYTNVIYSYQLILEHIDEKLEEAEDLDDLITFVTGEYEKDWDGGE